VIYGPHNYYDEVRTYLSASPLLGLLLTLVAFSPERLSLWRSAEVHLASAVVSLVAPAGVGGASGTGVVVGSLRHGGRDGCQGEGCGNGRSTGASLEHGFLRKVQPAGCTSPGRNSVVSPAV